MGWSEDGDEGLGVVEVEAPVGVRRVLGDALRPRLGVELPQTAKERPKQFVVLVNGAFHDGWRGHDDQRGVPTPGRGTFVVFDDTFGGNLGDFRV